MMTLTDIIFLGAVFTSLITSFVLVTKKTLIQLFSNKILALFLFLSSYCISSYLIITSGWILKIPFLYKTAAPINFLLPPLAYFYVDSVLNNKNLFRKSDIWHLLPFVVFLISYTPFYLISFEYKKLILENLYNQGSLGKTNFGIITEDIQFLVREAQSLVYIFYQWRLLIKYNNANTYSNKLNSIMYYWLKKFTLLISISTFSFIIYFFVSELGDKNLLNKIFCIITSVAFSCSYFVISCYLLYNPYIVYEAFQIKTNKRLGLYNSKQIVSNVKNIYEKEINLISTFFLENKPYLKNNLNLNEIALSLKIPARNFSFILNNHFHKRFSDFVNSYRIDYAIKEIESGYLESFTLESLAIKSGFNSIKTFNRAFKKIKKITPSEFYNSSVKSGQI